MAERGVPSTTEVIYLSPTRPVAAMLWAFALCWLVYLLVQPDDIYARLHTTPLLQAKAAWVYTTLGAAVLPLLVRINEERWHWLAWFSRLYMVGWCWALVALTVRFTISLMPFWGVALIFAVASSWLLFRFVTRGPARGAA